MKNPYKIARIVALGILGLIILIALITGANILFFWSIFNWLQNTIHGFTGWDVQISKGIAAFLVAIIVALPLGRFLLAYTPIPQKNKTLYRSLTAVVIALFFLFIWFGSQNTYFDSQTGKPLKYYSISPNGTYHFFSAPGFDPVTGDRLEPVTKEIVLKSKGRGKIEIPKKYIIVEKIVEKPAPPPAPVAQADETEKAEATTDETADETPVEKPAPKPTEYYRYKQTPKPYVPPIVINHDNRGIVTFRNETPYPVQILDNNQIEVFTIPAHHLSDKRMEAGQYQKMCGGESYGYFTVGVGTWDEYKFVDGGIEYIHIGSSSASSIHHSSPPRTQTYSTRQPFIISAPVRIYQSLPPRQPAPSYRHHR